MVVGWYADISENCPSPSGKYNSCYNTFLESITAVTTHSFFTSIKMFFLMPSTRGQF